MVDKIGVSPLAGWRPNVVGAPVEIDGEPYVLAAVVTKSPERTGLYVHEVILTKKLQSAIKTAVSSDTQNPTTEANPGAT